MDAGFAALLFGAVLYLVIEKTPLSWRHAAGGALVILTVLAIARQLASLS